MKPEDNISEILARMTVLCRQNWKYFQERNELHQRYYI